MQVTTPTISLFSFSFSFSYLSVPFFLFCSIVYNPVIFLYTFLLFFPSPLVHFKILFPLAVIYTALLIFIFIFLFCTPLLVLHIIIAFLSFISSAFTNISLSCTTILMIINEKHNIIQQQASHLV